MANLNKTFTFAAGPAASGAVNQNFDDIIAFLNNSVVHRDGSKDMSAPLALPAADPTSDNQAARKKYVDDTATAKAADAASHRSKFVGGVHTGYTGNVDLAAFFEPLESAQTLVVTTNAAGFVRINFPTAFPNGALAVIPCNGDANAFGFMEVGVVDMDKTGFDVRCMDANGNSLNNATVRINYIAKGW